MKESAGMLLLVIVVSVIVTAMTIVASATKVYDIGGNSWISCGGSAGNIQWDCPEGGGPCTSDPRNDARANQFCSLAPSDSEIPEDSPQF